MFSILPVTLGFFLGLSGCFSKANDKNDNAVSGQVLRYPYQIQSSSQAEDIERAEKLYKKKLREEPQSALIRSLLAAVYSQKAHFTGEMKFFDQAEALAKKSLKLLPHSNTMASLVLSSVAEARHDFPTAIKVAGEIHKNNSTNFGAVSILITAHLGFGKNEQAALYANQYASAKPTINSLTLQALVLEAQGNEDKAFKTFENAIRSEEFGQYEDSAWTRTFLGRLLMNYGRHELAKAYFDEALRILPDCHLALALSADLKLKNHDFAGAEQDFIKAIEAREEPPYMLRYAKLKTQLNDTIGAEQLRRRAEKLIRDEMTSGPYGHHNELAQLLIDRGNVIDLPEAIAEAKKDVKTRQTAESFALLAEVYFTAQLFTEARSAIYTALETGAENIDFFYLASSIEAALGNTVESQNFLEKAKGMLSKTTSP